MVQAREAPGPDGGEPTLRRSISLWQMTLYGTGGMVGAGIYGLIGQVAAEMGSAIWLAFAAGDRRQPAFLGLGDLMESPVGPETEAGLPLVFLAQGIVLTFYAFIGFEDSLNVAEELKNPRRNLPLGLVMALVLTVVIYMSVAISAASVVPWQELAEAKAPLAEVVALRGTVVSGLGVHRHYRVRGRQHRSDQLRHRVARSTASRATGTFRPCFRESIRCGARRMSRSD